MANQLKMAKVNAIRTLRERGWSRRRIARELGIHRETVGRYVRLSGEEAAETPPTAPEQGSDGPPACTGRGAAGAATGSAPAEPAEVLTGGAESTPAEVLTGGGESTPAKVPAGSDPSRPARALTGSGSPKPAKVLTGSECRSRCAPFRELILEKLERGLSAQRIYQDLAGEPEFSASYSSVQRFVRRLEARTPTAFRRMECDPGDEAQVDFGSGAWVIEPDGRRRRPHVFRVVLSHSRKAYSEVVYRQTTESFIRCLENAFHHFGGVPKTLVIDNLKAAVSKADWFDPDLNPKLQAFCDHYGTVLLPTRPYTPRHKGKVERGIGYVKDNALKGHTFASLQDQNRHLLEWEQHIADTRIHGTTRRQVGRVFEEVERAALLPLPADRFPFFHEAPRMVHRDAHVEVDKAYYSVPPEYVSRKVWARWDGRIVRVFNHQMEQIAMHVRHEPGRFSTKPSHLASKKISTVERGAEDLLSRAWRVGPHCGEWAAAMLKDRGLQGLRVLVGLLSLAKRYPYKRIERACETAGAHGAFRLRIIRELIKRQDDPQSEFEFTQQHPIIRELSDYGELIADHERRNV